MILFGPIQLLVGVQFVCISYLFAISVCLLIITNNHFDVELCRFYSGLILMLPIDKLCVL